MSDVLFQPKKTDGWHHLSTEYIYPPFHKKIEVFFADAQQTKTGQIIMSGDNRVCIKPENETVMYDLDQYFTYWRIIE